MTKEKTARLIPNAIQIATEGEKVKNFSTFALLHNVEEICLSVGSISNSSWS